MGAAVSRAVEDDENFNRNDGPVVNIASAKTEVPAWKRPPQIQLSMGNLSLSDEVLADRSGGQAEERNQ